MSAKVHIKAYGKNSDEVYSTTIHEIAHASHWVNNVFVYDDIVQDAFLGHSAAIRNNNRRLLESWATTVEIAFALERYTNVFNVAGYEYLYGNFQNLMIQDQNHYTSGGWDMIDDINQRTDPDFGNGDLDFPADNVSGYSITQLENALFTANSWWKWRDNIINMYDNPTEGNLFELFANWPDN
ncbi:hypothetical protein [Olleya aquimaris]|uniref:Uncharacterized protein n=1 Tax=Olleya aquimaris TaxID=639310 RepID=A0A327R872_9FLAO|nr:hypothetical protein [Olleya aquimaris]RAJ12162.1 hypothetical protein LY08_02415 [Olleya aquimaris]